MTTTEVATLVDSNVLLDVIRADPLWSSWSAETLARVADEGPLVINSIIYAEVSATYATVEEVDAVLLGPAFVRSEVPWPAALLAGCCHAEHRRRGGAWGCVTARAPLCNKIGAQGVMLQVYSPRAATQTEYALCQ